MGLRGISIGSILIVLLIVFLIFGSKRLRNIGEDIGVALKGFRKGVKDVTSEQDSDNENQSKS